jgi:hypothetical protein
VIDRPAGMFPIKYFQDLREASPCDGSIIMWFIEKWHTNLLEMAETHHKKFVAVAGVKPQSSDIQNMKVLVTQ